MPEELYFWIYNSDGDVSVTPYTQQELLQELNERLQQGSEPPVFLDKVPDNTDTNYWGYKELIIKGQVVVPKPIDVVREFDIE